jgi:hypothetical protein
VLESSPTKGGVSLNELNRQHKIICDKVEELRTSLIDQQPRPTESISPLSDSDGLKKRDIAMALKSRHPEWSDTKLAREAGVSRTSLYRWPEFSKAKEILEDGRKRLPRGSKQNKSVEAWDESEDCDGDSLGDT